MTAKDLIKKAFGQSDLIIGRYFDGLKDADLMIRGVPGMNHLAWQIGHLIVSEHQLVDLIRPGATAPLPDGFAEAHSKEAAHSDDPSKFLTLQEYRAIWKTQREATLKLLEELPEEDLDREEPGRFPPFAPTVGQLMFVAGTHPVLHAGQFVPVRRKLGLPIAF